jgi:predicted TIM-barrel fold metal-dependent hydrolase
VGPFLRAAQEYKVPVAVHTAYDRFSKPDRVADVARQFMDVDFILYHAGLDPPDIQTGMKVLERVASQSNLYIDISWLEYERLERAIEIIPDRVMFGTDVPLGGQQHYDRYFDCLDRLRDAERLTEEKRSKLLHENCQRVFSRLINENQEDINL